MTEEERDLVDRMATFIKYHDIKSLMQLVMKAIESAGDKEIESQESEDKE